ncbi:cupin domain-containing protein [Oceanobacillus salinisoli]|uniref:hypothetical protein n=1 Tax=Oceanobacillus salinisoli TaxID=2678611 RepID=UPI0012E13BFA|nr:hypothetical protein [Oceanobacillus salinisoli]
MYDKTDPRANLAKEKSKTEVSHDIAPAKVVKCYEDAPIMTPKGSRIWWSRGQNFYLEYSETVDGEVFERREQVDEYVIFLPDHNSSAIIQWGNEKVEVEGYSLAVVPKGSSDLKITSGGRLIRLFSSQNIDLEDLPINKKDYQESDLNVASFTPWPESPEGSKVRVYSLDVPKEEGRFGRIFRCSTFMVNFLDPFEGPRDPSKLSPHSHADFEQCSLILQGEFIHHFRWPWTSDKRKWREDSHEVYGSPSVTVIPPGVIHTSQAVGTGTNILVDIFCPPRMDFSKQAGWVLNENDYPID